MTIVEEMKNKILANFPKGFHCAVSKNCITVWIWVDINKVGGWDNANRLVYGLAKKLKLDEVSAGTDVNNMVRDWEFTNRIAEKQMVAEAKDVLNTMKSFFSKYGNAYCASSKCYSIIDKMRNIIATDED